MAAAGQAGTACRVHNSSPPALQLPGGQSKDESRYHTCSIARHKPPGMVACQVSPRIGLKGFRQHSTEWCRPVGTQHGHMSTTWTQQHVNMVSVAHMSRAHMSDCHQMSIAVSAVMVIAACAVMLQLEGRCSPEAGVPAPIQHLWAQSFLLHYHHQHTPAHQHRSQHQHRLGMQGTCMLCAVQVGVPAVAAGWCVLTCDHPCDQQLHTLQWVLLCCCCVDVIWVRPDVCQLLQVAAWLKHEHWEGGVH